MEDKHRKLEGDDLEYVLGIIRELPIHAQSSPETKQMVKGLKKEVVGELKTLSVRLEDIASDMSKGFQGVYKRQDHTNGNVKCNTEWRLKNSKVPIIVYGLVGLILTAFGGAVVRLIIT